ncbi:MAG: Gfo/Idh/MocA family oxidoreductase [Candidatus Bathyarchaeia archaeon]
MRRIKVGIVGLGIMGRVHTKAYKSHPNVEVIAVCDIDEAKAESFAREFSIPRFYTDFRAMSEDPELEAVSITTPDFSHKEPVITFAKAGKDILCEKPLATSTSDAEEMVKAARNSGVKLMVAFHNRWSPPYAILKSRVISGELGSPIYAYARLCDTIYVPTKMISWSSKTSVIWFLGSHVVDLVRWIFEREAEKVYCVKRGYILKSMNIETEDFLHYIVEFQDGAVALFENSWVLPETLPSVVDFASKFVFTKGCVYVDTHHSQAMRVFTSAKAENPDLFGGPLEIHGHLTGFNVRTVWHFVECLIEDKTPLSTGEDGLAVTKIIEAALKSAAEGKPVKI